MRMPQVSERVKEAPAQALRGVFAGLGQLLLITDKLRNKTPIHGGTPQAKPGVAEAAPEAPVAATSAVPEAAVVEVAPEAEGAPEVAAKPEAVENTGSAEKQRESDKTGNVRLLTERTAAPEAVEAVEVREPSEVSEASELEVAGVPEAAAEAAEAKATAAEAEAVETPAAEAGAVGDEAPLPNYDELTVASLRARLRNLSIEQVRELAEYERTHAGRPEVVAMFERRAAKLEAGA